MKDPYGELLDIPSIKEPWKIFLWHFHYRSYYDVYLDTYNGFIPYEVKKAAIECGAPNDPTKSARWYGNYIFKLAKAGAYV